VTGYLLEFKYELTPATTANRPGAWPIYQRMIDVKTVPLYGRLARGRVALVDDADYELVMRYRWHAWEKRGRENKRDDGPYAQASIRLEDDRKSTIRMHKLLAGWPQTDHRNGNGLDNQRSNLRPATKAQNNHNQKPRTGHSSRFKGVAWHMDTGKWQASIKVNGRQRYLGVFASEEEAAAVYTAAALQVQGEYAYAARKSQDEDAA